MTDEELEEFQEAMGEQGEKLREALAKTSASIPRTTEPAEQSPTAGSQLPTSKLVGLSVGLPVSRSRPESPTPPTF